MNISKDYKKAVSKVRADLGTNGYPKAMMTGQQMRKCTATVNCGGEWHGKTFSEELASKVIQHEAFKDFLKSYHAEAHIEKASYAGREYAQVRIYYPEEVL